MKTLIQTLLLLTIVSCVPDGMENDRLADGLDTATKVSEKSQTDFISKAISAGQLYKDTIGNYNLALLYLDSALLQDKNSVKALRLKSHFLSIQNRPADALKAINTALTLNPRDEDSYLAKAYVLLKSGDKVNAYACYTDIVKINSKNFKALEAIGYMDIENKDLSKGCSCLKRIRDEGYQSVYRQADSLLCGKNWR